METYNNDELDNNNKNNRTWTRSLANMTTSYDNVTINKCSRSYEYKVNSTNGTHNSVKPRVRAIGLQVKNFQPNSAFRNLETRIHTEVAHREEAGCTLRCNGIHCSVYQCDYGHGKPTYTECDAGCTCLHRNALNWYTPVSSYQNSCNRVANNNQDSNGYQLANFPLPTNYHCCEPICFPQVSVCNHTHSCSTQPYYGHGFDFNIDQICRKWCSEKKNMCYGTSTPERNEIRSSTKVQYHTKTKTAPLRPSKSKYGKQAQKHMAEEMSNTSSLDKYKVYSKENNKHSSQGNVNNNVTLKKFTMESAKDADQELLVSNYKLQQKKNNMDLRSPKTEQKKREMYEEYLKKYKSENLPEIESNKKEVSRIYKRVSNILLDEEKIQPNEMSTKIQKDFPPKLQHNNHKKVNNSSTIMRNQQKSEPSSSPLKSNKQLSQEDHLTLKVISSKPQSDMQLIESPPSQQSKNALNINCNSGLKTLPHLRHGDQVQPKYKDNESQPKFGEIKRSLQRIQLTQKQRDSHIKPSNFNIDKYKNQRVQQQMHNPNNLLQDQEVESYDSHHHHLRTIQYGKQYFKNSQKIQRKDETCFKPRLNADDQPSTLVIKPKFCGECENAQQQPLQIRYSQHPFLKRCNDQNDRQITHNYRQFQQQNVRRSHLFNYNYNQVDSSNMNEQRGPPLSLLDSNSQEQDEYVRPDQEVSARPLVPVSKTYRSQYNTRNEKVLKSNHPEETATTSGMPNEYFVGVQSSNTQAQQNFIGSVEKSTQKTNYGFVGIEDPENSVVLEEKTNNQNFDCSSKETQRQRRSVEFSLPNRTEEAIKPNITNNNKLISNFRHGELESYYQEQVFEVSNLNFQSQNDSVAKLKESNSIILNSETKQMTFHESYLSQAPLSVHNKERNFYQEGPNVSFSISHRNRYNPLQITNYSNPDEYSCHDLTDDCHSSFRTTSSCATIPIYLDSNDEDYRTCDESLCENNCEMLPMLNACSCMYDAYIDMASHCEDSKINRYTKAIRFVSANDLSS